MNILVAVKRVVDYNARVRVRPGARRAAINADYALEADLFAAMPELVAALS